MPSVEQMMIVQKTTTKHVFQDMTKRDVKKIGWTTQKNSKFLSLKIVTTTRG
jgi:hypothetical protein